MIALPPPDLKSPGCGVVAITRAGRQLSDYYHSTSMSYIEIKRQEDGFPFYIDVRLLPFKNHILKLKKPRDGFFILHDVLGFTIQKLHIENLKQCDGFFIYINIRFLSFKKHILKTTDFSFFIDGCQ